MHIKPRRMSTVTSRAVCEIFLWAGLDSCAHIILHTRLAAGFGARLFLSGGLGLIPRGRPRLRERKTGLPLIMMALVKGTSGGVFSLWLSRKCR